MKARGEQEINSPKNQPQISYMTMGQYWLAKTKPQKVSDRHKMPLLQNF